MDDSKFPDFKEMMRPNWVCSRFSDRDLTTLKKKGNAHFKNDNYEEALQHYLAILHRTKHVNQNSKLIVDSYNNIALIYFKIKRYYECIDKCDIVLAIDSNQNKATFRRNKSYSILKKEEQNTFDIKSTEYPLIHKKLLKKMGVIPSPLYEVRQIPYDVNKMGFFATKRIKSGTIILKESSLFTLRTHTNDTVQFGPLGSARRWNGNEDKIHNILNSLPKAQCNMFKTMRASDIEMNDHYHNIYLTNNIILNEEYGAIFPTACRLNHCCVANTSGDLNKSTSKYQVVAVKDIEKGEQISTSFISSAPLKKEDRRNELLKLYGFICECKYCNFRTCDEYEMYTNEFVVLRQRLLNMMSDMQRLKKQNPFKIVKRILYIFEHHYDSNAYYMDDYTEHAFLCALVKNDFKHIVRYAALHTFWNNVKCGYIIDDGHKRYEYKWKVPQIIQAKKLHKTVHSIVNSVVADKRIPQCIYEGPFAE